MTIIGKKNQWINDYEFSQDNVKPSISIWYAKRLIKTRLRMLNAIPNWANIIWEKYTELVIMNAYYFTKYRIWCTYQLKMFFFFISNTIWGNGRWSRQSLNWTVSIMQCHFYYYLSTLHCCWSARATAGSCCSEAAITMLCYVIFVCERPILGTHVVHMLTLFRGEKHSLRLYGWLNAEYEPMRWHYC